MENLVPENLTFSEVGHLPIIKDFAKKIGLVETLDAMVDSEMELSPGIAVLAMVLDTLSGRTPLYRLEEFFQEKDTELMLGHDVQPELFCDYNLGRVLDKVFDTGTQKVFSRIAQNALGVFEIDPRRVHFDTTSVSVFGDYDFVDPPLKITYGHSKDKRPDLKQFLVSMLCVDRNIPILGGTEDGNASDKSLNNELLGGVSRHMARHGLKPGAFVYVADAAFVTPDNLKKAKEKNVKFLTRLPATYKACGRAISEAVLADSWVDIGELNQTPATKKRPAAYYRGFETTVALYDDIYRAVVIHSSAYDKRRHKRIDRLVHKKRQDLETLLKKINTGPFYCRTDAEAAVEKMIKATANSYHKLQYKISKVAKYPRGRPAKGKPRTPIGYEYPLDVQIELDGKALAPLRLKAGCFVDSRGRIFRSLLGWKDHQGRGAPFEAQGHHTGHNQSRPQVEPQSGGIPHEDDSGQGGEQHLAGHQHPAFPAPAIKKALIHQQLGRHRGRHDSRHQEPFPGIGGNNRIGHENRQGDQGAHGTEIEVDDGRTVGGPQGADQGDGQSRENGAHHSRELAQQRAGHGNPQHHANSGQRQGNAAHLPLSHLLAVEHEPEQRRKRGEGIEDHQGAGDGQLPQGRDQPQKGHGSGAAANDQ